LDWLEAQSTIYFGNVGRKERRSRKKELGRDREEGMILFTGRRDYNNPHGMSREATRAMKNMNID